MDKSRLAKTARAGTPETRTDVSPAERRRASRRRRTTRIGSRGDPGTPRSESIGEFRVETESRASPRRAFPNLANRVDTSRLDEERIALQILSGLDTPRPGAPGAGTRAKRGESSITGARHDIGPAISLESTSGPRAARQIRRGNPPAIAQSGLPIEFVFSPTSTTPAENARRAETNLVVRAAGAAAMVMEAEAILSVVLTGVVLGGTASCDRCPLRCDGSVTPPNEVKLLAVEISKIFSPTEIRVRDCSPYERKINETKRRSILYGTS